MMRVHLFAALCTAWAWKVAVGRRLEPKLYILKGPPKIY